MLKVYLEFKPQDCWVGVFWRYTTFGLGPPIRQVDVWICLLPMLPIHVIWQSWKEKP